MVIKLHQQQQQQRVVQHLLQQIMKLNHVEI